MLGEVKSGVSVRMDVGELGEVYGELQPEV